MSIPSIVTAEPSTTGLAFPGAKARSPRLMVRRADSNRPPFKLIGALRGHGQLEAGGHLVPVSYQIDAFSAGLVRTATGGLEGDFDALDWLADISEATSVAGRLTLETGAVLAVMLVGQAPGLLEIDLPCNVALTSQF